LGDAKRRARRRGADLPEGVVGEVSATLHVVDAGAIGTIAVDPERQALNEAHGMHGVVVAQHQDARRVLAPCRAYHEMIAAAVASRDTLNTRRQAGIALGYQLAKLVDLCRCFRRRLDLDPAADAVEDVSRVERIAGCHCHWPSACIEVRPMS